MKLTTETWTNAGFGKHFVTRVDFDASDIGEAFNIAKAKLFHTNSYDPNGVAREHRVMESRLVAGELADQAVLSILNDFYLSNNQQYDAIEYDSIRQDNFTNSAPYSILIRHLGNSIKTVEVRSSFCYRLPDPRMMISKLSTYGWYTSYGKPAEDPKDIYFQAFYHLRPQSIEKLAQWPDIPEFENCLRQGKVSIYVVGGADKVLLQNAGVVKKDDADGAFYQAIYPANTGYDVPELCTNSIR